MTDDVRNRIRDDQVEGIHPEEDPDGKPPVWLGGQGDEVTANDTPEHDQIRGAVDNAVENAGDEV